jgi:hypothetical protein
MSKSLPTLSPWQELLPSRLTPREAKGGCPYVTKLILITVLGVSFN